jgi:hypothetical protein
MDAKKAMKIVYDEVKRGKDFSANGTSIAISPKDFKGRLSGTDLWRTVQKMANDYNLFIVTLSPDAIIAHQYDDIVEMLKPSEEHKHRYLLHLNDNFDDFPKLVLEESLPKSIEPEYFPFYIQIMFQAISELGITQEHQPAKKEIEGWFKDNYPALSGNDIKALSTFVRHPDKKQGGWHSNKKKD